MSLDQIDLAPTIRKVSERLLAAIEASDSMLQGVKTGARAEGYVLGLKTAATVTAEQVEALSALFEEATERRLRGIAAGR